MNSSNTLPQLASGTSRKEVITNALFAAASVAMFGAYNVATSGALVWGYLGGPYGDETVANGTHTCAASDTTYQVADLATGEISFSISDTDWNDLAFGRCYEIITNASGVTTYYDRRFGPRGIFTAAAVAGSGDMLLAAIQVITAAKTFNDGTLKLAGSTSGALSLKAPAVAGTGDVNLPATGTLATLAGTETLTNKTLTDPVVGTQSAGDNSTKAASTAYTDAAIAALIGTAPGVLNTLGEISDAINDDANLYTTLATLIAAKSPIASPAFTGVPEAPTAAPGTNTTQLATTAFVEAAVASSTVSDGDKGDVVVSGTGLIWSLDISGVAAGTYANPTITFDAKGRATLAINGAGSSSSPTVPVDFKDSVDCATTANITLSGEQTIDGFPTSASRVLVKDQTTGSQNGPYLSGAGAWTRTTDADTSGEVTSGMQTYVENGTLNGNQVFTLTTADPITLDTTALTFSAQPISAPAFIGKTVGGTTYTTVLTDTRKRLNCTHASPKTVTIAPFSSVAAPVNTEIEAFNVGAGLLTLAPGVGVTLNSAGGILTVGQYQGVRLKKRANPNTWDVTGISSGGATVPLGGTGVAAFTAYAPIFGGTTSTDPLQSGTVGTAGYVLTSNGPGALPTFQPGAGGTIPTQTICVVASDEVSALTAGTSKVKFRMPFAFTISDIRASLGTAATGATLLAVDVNEAGSTILSTKLTFDAGEKTTTTAATARVISDTSLADDAEITIDIDAVGSTVTGAGLKVYIIGTPVTAKEFIPIAVGDETTALTTGVAKVTFRMPYAFTVTDVRASVSTAPTGGTLLTVDINEAGVSFLSTKLTFDASETTTTTATTPRVISDSSLANDAEITIDIDAVGSTIAGAGLKVYLIGNKT